MVKVRQRLDHQTENKTEILGLHSWHIRCPMLVRNCINAIGCSNPHQQQRTSSCSSNFIYESMTSPATSCDVTISPSTWHKASLREREAPNENTWRPSNWWATKLKLWVMAKRNGAHKQWRLGIHSRTPKHPATRTPEGNHWPRLHFNWLSVSFALHHIHVYVLVVFVVLRPPQLCIFHDKIINQRWIR